MAALKAKQSLKLKMIKTGFTCVRKKWKQLKFNKNLDFFYGLILLYRNFKKKWFDCIKKSTLIIVITTILGLQLILQLFDLIDGELWKKKICEFM